jgi:hypothetical protein
MNIAQQAHQDGQEFRKANGAQGAGEAYVQATSLRSLT